MANYQLKLPIKVHDPANSTIHHVMVTRNCYNKIYNMGTTLCNINRYFVEIPLSRTQGYYSYVKSKCINVDKQFYWELINMKL